MHVLLLRPVPSNDRFGLGPFFTIEPLGLEYIAAALEARGHRTTTVDLRYGGSLERHLRRSRPAVVGIACMHALETDEVLALTARIRRASPGAFILVGGHSAAAYPTPFFANTVDAICMDDGEMVVPALVDAIANRRPPREVPGLIVREADGRFEKTSRWVPSPWRSAPGPSQPAGWRSPSSFPARSFPPRSRIFRSEATGQCS